MICWIYIKKINEGKNGKQKSLLRMTYTINSDEKYKFFVEAELKPSMSDLTSCIQCENGDHVCYELFYKNRAGTENYEFYIQECFDNKFHNIEYEDLKKHYFVFLALINPVFILDRISKTEHMTNLIENNESTIELSNAELKIEIYHESYVL